jgi:hypothetical protein
MATRVHLENDTLAGDSKPAKQIRTVYVEDDDGMQTFVVRPYAGSVEIRTNGRSISVDAYAIPALLRALRDAAKEV